MADTDQEVNPNCAGRHSPHEPHRLFPANPTNGPGAWCGGVPQEDPDAQDR